MLSSARCCIASSSTGREKRSNVTAASQENDTGSTSRDVVSKPILKYCGLLRRADLGEDLGWRSASNALMRRLRLFEE